MYDRVDGAVWKVVADEPKANDDEPKAAEAARVLEACDLNFLLMLQQSASRGARGTGESDIAAGCAVFPMLIEMCDSSASVLKYKLKCGH
jgi:hypothetical protein